MSIVSSTLSELEDEGQVFVSKLEGESDEFNLWISAVERSGRRESVACIVHLRRKRRDVKLFAARDVVDGRLETSTGTVPIDLYLFHAMG